MSASIRDVAQLAGVSVGTVSNVLNRPDEVAGDTVSRVNAAIKQLDYVRNDAARRLRQRVSRSVGFVVLNGQNPFFTEVVRGAEDEAIRNGMALIQGNSDEDAAREQMYLDLFEQQQVAGVIIAPHGDVTSQLERLRSRGIVSVLVDRLNLDGRFSSVSVDNALGGRLAVEHLIRTGRRRIALVGGPFDLRLMDERLAGARVAVDDAGPSVELEVVVTEAMSVEEGAAAGARILERRRSDRPDAIFAGNDLLALGLLQALVVDGRSLVPGEIALIGFDDIPFAAAAAIPLTTVRQPSRAIGRTALRVLFEESSDPEAIPRQTVFQPELILRASA